MKINGKHYRSVWPIGEDAFGIIDQTKLPHEFATLTLKSWQGERFEIPLFGELAARDTPPRVVFLEAADDTLQLYFLCAHPSLTPASAVALTLRAVGGLTTRQIAEAYLVPEATMAQRISRAKRAISGVRLGEPGDLATVLRVLYLVFNQGYSGEIDLAEEAIRLARQVTSMTDDEETAPGIRCVGVSICSARGTAQRTRRRIPGCPWRCP